MTESVKIKPLNDRVVIKPNVLEEKTQGGIYIPTKTDEKVSEGQVVAIGLGRLIDGQRQAIDLRVGQEVIFNQYSGTEVKRDGETYVVLREDDIMAVIE